MENFQLWRGVQEVRLTGKAFAVLRYLVEHAGEVATKDDLFTAAWPETVVSEATLVSSIQELRQALRDDAKNPRYIETMHRRGYRFIGKVVRSKEGVRSQHSVAGREEPSVDGQESDAVLPQAGIQELQTEAVSESPWIPASAGMTPLPSAPQNDVNGGQESAFSPLSPHPEPPLNASPPPARRAWSVRTLVFMGLVLLVAVSLTVQYLSRPSLSTQSSVLSTAAPQALPLPDKPSIIVLPLVNLSGDPEQDYFSDGLTEVLTGDLSRISSLFVIARNSAFTYKGKAVKVQDVGREMGVRYVLEGSVQKAEQHVRITIQLIEAITGYHLWSEQYDRPLKDIFALQDEIVQKIVTTLKLQLTLQEQGYVVRKHTDNLEAYDAFLRGQEYHHRLTQEANAQARQLYEKAIELDPQYAEAYAWLGYTYWIGWIWRWSVDPQTLEHALVLAQQAVSLDDSLPLAHSALSLVYAEKQQYDQAITEGEHAIALDPNNADSYAFQASALNWAGRPEEALRMVEQTMRLNPRSPPGYLFALGWAYRSTGRYAESVATMKEALSRSPNFLPAHTNLAVSYLWQWVSQQSPAAQTLEPAVAAVQRALALNDSYHWNHIYLGWIYLYQQQYEQALVEMERGVALAPTEARSYAALAVVLSCMGRTEDALEATAQALRLKPIMVDAHLDSVGAAYATAGRPEEAIAPLHRYLSRYPNILGAHLMLAAVYSELGKEAEAHAEATEVLRLNPNFSLEVHKERMPIKDPATLERHIAALRKAGLK
jgi:TolB-like protein/DNA-binding winged helix-turn-helix (wHTH) protein/Tfp pilus assembly protein PilF